MYLLSNIHIHIDIHIPGRPVISTCGTPTEKVSEFLDHHLKTIMQKCQSCIKDTHNIFIIQLRG